ncbi:hypothetical protein PG994_013597 [Apiospora phragmitis]|uniref:Uncharacterized protein n=1 Tax=Apiospora phragmitis TaxID=2905665 RepID=A0ABR1TBE2_9PEZI
MSLQFDLCSEIYWMTDAKLPAAEELSQMPLTSHFFNSSHHVGHIQDVEKAQLLVLTLGTVHAAANPLSPWHALQRACAPSIAGTIKSHVLARSEQVKRGIRSQPKGLAKSYAWFGNQELAASTNDASGWIDLVAPEETSLALACQEWQDRADQYETEKRMRAEFTEASCDYIRSIVNL